MAECQKYLKSQVPTETHSLRDITRGLWNYQRKRPNMSYNQCNQMVKDHFEGSQDKSENASSDSSSDAEEESEVEELVPMEESDGGLTDQEESDKSASDKDMFSDEEDVEVKTFLAVNKIEDLIQSEESLPDNVVKSRYYRRAKRKYFVDSVESKTVFEVLSQLSQVPEAVSYATLIQVLRRHIS